MLAITCGHRAACRRDATHDRELRCGDRASPRHRGGVAPRARGASARSHASARRARLRGGSSRAAASVAASARRARAHRSSGCSSRAREWRPCPRCAGRRSEGVARRRAAERAAHGGRYRSTGERADQIGRAGPGTAGPTGTTGRAGTTGTGAHRLRRARGPAAGSAAVDRSLTRSCARTWWRVDVPLAGRSGGHRRGGRHHRGHGRRPRPCLERRGAERSWPRLRSPGETMRAPRALCPCARS